MNERSVVCVMVYIYKYMCVCVCVGERKKDRDGVAPCGCVGVKLWRYETYALCLLFIRGFAFSFFIFNIFLRHVY